jgi:hypothetical protein
MAGISRHFAFWIMDQAVARSGRATPPTTFGRFARRIFLVGSIVRFITTIFIAIVTHHNHGGSGCGRVDNNVFLCLRNRFR